MTLLAKCSPITQYLALHPNLLAVGRVAHDMCTSIVRQNYIGVHVYAEIVQSLSFKRKIYSKFKMTI